MATSTMRLNTEEEPTETSGRSESGRDKLVSPTCLLMTGLALGAGLLGGLVGGLIGRASGGSGAPAPSPVVPVPATQADADPLAFANALHGTNLGGWLHLEDWFFSGEGGRWVSTGNNAGQGVCLPPAVPTVAEPWPSEGILVKRLNKSRGPQQTVEAFQAHRRSFIDADDIRKMAKLGLKTIRVPLTWALFPDALETLAPGTYGGFDPKTEAAIIPDPYYHEIVAYVTVPRNFVEEMLRVAATHGVKFLLDMHCLPGGSSNGTYNGIFPNHPKFWTSNSKLGNTSMSLIETGLLVAQAMVRWVESMDMQTRSAVAGLTFMNEPAHMNAWSNPHFAQEEQIFDFLAASADIFRKSQLPQLGIKLFVNLVETGIRDFDTAVPEWWEKTFTPQERGLWAVIDRHWYAAWSGKYCSGRVTSGGAYFCDQDIDSMRKVWREGTCARKWAEGFKKMFPDSLRACSEMSASTFQDAFLACSNPDLVRAFIEEQAQGMKDNGVDAFFWTWRMPYGPAFEQGWSLKHIAGLESTPTRPCKPTDFTLISV